MPLNHPEYTVTYINRPPDPGMFTPKAMDYSDRITCYWVSPRMMIHHGICQGSGFTYSSNFYHEGITVFTQLEQN